MTSRPNFLSIDCLFESDRSEVGDSPACASPKRARMSAEPAKAGDMTPFSSTWAPRLWTTPSSLRNLASNSASGGFLDFLGARPGPGNTHSIPALTQFAHGFSLSHLTFRRRHVTQLRGLWRGAGGLIVAPFWVFAGSAAEPSLSLLVGSRLGRMPFSMPCDIFGYASVHTQVMAIARDVLWNLTNVVSSSGSGERARR